MIKTSEDRSTVAQNTFLVVLHAADDR